LKSNLGKAWKILLALSFVFINTFVVFPGAFLNEHFTFMDNFEWYFITVILIFNVFDTIGRKLANYINLPANVIIVLSYSRILILILTIILTQTDDNGVPILDSNAVKIINLVLFSITNGYTSTQCCMKAPSYVPKD